MLSFNQSVTGSDNTCHEPWSDSQLIWAPNTYCGANQIEQWSHPEEVVWHPTLKQNWSHPHQPVDHDYYSYQNQSSSSMSNQVTQGPVQQTQLCSAPNQYLKPKIPGKHRNSHHARITLLSNTNGTYKAVVKRKRKRTMFTTEQIEALESVFKRKPYITKEDRQVLVKQLQIADTSVKVWFQNRRLRGKRELEQAIEEASEMYEDLPSEEMSYSFSNLSQYNQELSSNVSITSARLDHIESELIKKADESGYVTLDEKVIGDIVSIIDSVLSPDIDLESIQTSDCESSNNTEEIVAEEDSDDSTCADSIYEPISPAGSDSTDEKAPRWQRTAPDQSLQRLFDLHFC